MKNVNTEKHGKMRGEIILPKKGNLARFTLIFEEWLAQVPSEDSFVFPSGNSNGLNFLRPQTRSRSHRIIKSTTGKFPHWFRAVAENIYGRLVFGNNPYKLKDFMGLVNLESTTPYIQAQLARRTRQKFSNYKRG